jgi:hypothetical protein
MPRTLGANTRIHAIVQRAYATEVLGYPVWGLSPSARPAGEGYGYGEFGVTVLGVAGYPAGIVSPHASALALAVIPKDAVANLRALADRYDVYGEFGFYDAVEPTSGRVVHAYLALDQAMILVAAANHLRAGRLQRLFEQDPIIDAAIATLRARSALVARRPERPHNETTADLVIHSFESPPRLPKLEILEREAPGQRSRVRNSSASAPRCTDHVTMEASAMRREKMSCRASR